MTVAELRTALPRLRDRLPLGRGLRVSPVCLGMVRDPQAISAAYDAGINFFFVSADMHWPYYEGIRRGLADLFKRSPGARDDVVVAGCSYVTRPEFCHAPFTEILDAVPGLERLDLTIAGGAAQGELDVRAREYQAHERIGAKAFGASFHERVFAAQCITARRVDLAYVRYNPVHRGAEEDLFPHVRARGEVLVYNFKSTFGFLPEAAYGELGLSTDHWRPSITDYYRFALARPELDGLLVAMGTPAHVEELARALEGGPLTDEERTYLADLADLAKGEARLATG